MNSTQAIPSYSPVTFAAALTPKGTARLQSGVQRISAPEAKEPPAVPGKAGPGGVDLGA
jgi:hypothetical protein